MIMATMLYNALPFKQFKLFKIDEFVFINAFCRRVRLLCSARHGSSLSRAVKEPMFKLHKLTVIYKQKNLSVSKRTKNTRIRQFGLGSQSNARIERCSGILKSCIFSIS